MKQFVDYFIEVHEGYLDIKQLLEDTVVILKTTKTKKIVPFTVSVDEITQEKIIIRYGQLDKFHLVEGLGRKITFNYKSDIDPNGNETIVKFNPR